MKPLLFFFVCVAIGLGISIFYKQYTLLQLKQAVKTPLSKIIPFSLAVPPPASLKGMISKVTQDVQWQAREATEPGTLSQKFPVLQGEEFWTGEKGTLEIVFPQKIRFMLFPNSHISFIQTLPESFVVLQDSGTITYSTAQRISIRISPLLIQQNSGEVTIEKDEEASQIVLTVKKGLVLIGFNDSENVSNVVSVKEGNSYTFDIPSRTGEMQSTDE